MEVIGAIPYHARNNRNNNFSPFFPFFVIRKPGRNLAVIIEVAAMNNRQKKLGYNAAQELLSALGMDFDMSQTEKVIVDKWE